MVTIFKLSSDWLFLLVTVLFVNIHVVTCATQAEERISQDVKIKLYDLSTSDWTTSLKQTFATVIAAEATTYCTNSPSSCGLDSAATFTSSEMGTSSSEKDGSSIEFTVYIDYPGSASVTAGGATAHVVPKAAAQAIAADARDDVKYDVGYYITYIDDEYYSIPPNTTINKIIVPIAFIAVFLLAISAVAMHKYKKYKARDDKIKERRERRKQYGGTSALDTTTTTTTILTTNNGTTPRHGITNNNSINAAVYFAAGEKVSTKDKGGYNRWEDEDEGPVVVSLKPKPQPKFTPTVNEFHDGQMEDGGFTMETNIALQPLPIKESLDEEEARRERKRRRKEKRREKKRKEENGVMQMSYENQAFDTSNLSEGSYVQPSVEVDD